MAQDVGSDNDREGRRGRLSAAKRLLLEQRLRGELNATAVSRTIPPRLNAFEAPLSFAQERLWFLEQLEPGTALYIIPATLQLRAPVDAAALERSLNEIVRRHEILRTSFTTVDGQVIQVIAPALTLPLQVVDLALLEPLERGARVRSVTAEVIRRPFDLVRGPLLRAALLLDPEVEEQTLILAMHHIVSDAWSLELLFGELLALYEAFRAGKHPPLPDLPIQYADYALWQREWLQGDVLEQQLTYWKRQLADLSALQLPTDRPRLAMTYRGARQSITLSDVLVEALRKLSQREGASPFMTLLAAFATLLYRYTGQDDIVVGAPIAGRTRAETERLIGFFLNTLVLRVDTSGDPSFRELLGRVRDMALGAYAHQELPFEKLLAELHPERSLGQTPLFQVFFNYFVDTYRPPGRGDGLQPEAADARFDLTLYAIEHAGTIELLAVYNIDLFDDATITRMLEHIETLLGSVVQEPDRHLSALRIITDAEQRMSIAQRIGQPATPPLPFEAAEIEQSIPSRFARMVAAYPHHVAISTGTTSWTYAKLDQEADRIADAILARYPGANQRVALLFEHGAMMVAAILGALKAGKTYVPLDLAYPRQRMLDVLAHTRVIAIITNRTNLTLAAELARGDLDMIDVEQLDVPAPSAPTRANVSPDANAYILYTSGSTGRPKGIVQSHRNVLHHIRAYTNNLRISPRDRLALLASYSFDAAVMDIFGALLNGVTLCLFNVREEGPERLARWLLHEAITIYHSTPTLYRYLMHALVEAPASAYMRLIVLGGEEVTRRDVELYKRFFPQGCTLVNGFGPTESTLALQYFISPETDLLHTGVPIGYPVHDTTVLLLNAAGEEVAVYGIGEIVIQSEHVALGYWEQPDLTRAAFLLDPGGSRTRMYRTGDYGRLMPDGTIVFAGRKDSQVKLRGYRIEVGEIEARLLEHASIREATVLLRADGDLPSEKCLVAYVVPAPQQSITATQLHQFLRERLPMYMVPSAFMVLPALPLTTTGKVDRRALPPPNQAKLEETAHFVAPRTPVEEELAAIWGELLGLEQVGVEDDFFELGGHSLLITRMVSRVRDRFAVEIPLRRIFERPRIAELASTIAEQPANVPHIPPIVAVSREQYRVRLSARKLP